MNKPRIVVFVQARMGSVRLPGKAIKNVLGKELLARMVDRIKRASTVDDAVVITSTNESDVAVAGVCEANGILCFRGSELDLLDRHYLAAIRYEADFVVKIPSDCPLTDPKIIDQVVSLWLENQDQYDYVSNYHPPTFPDGLDVEGCPISILEIAWMNASKPHEREHTFPYIWDNPGRFRIGNVFNPLGNLFMSHRWTLDYDEDFQFISRIYEEFKGKELFLMDDILDLLARKPEIHEINRVHSGVNWYRKHEGELKTVMKDQYRKDEQHP